jgi:hypothetical protein
MKLKCEFVWGNNTYTGYIEQIVTEERERQESPWTKAYYSETLVYIYEPKHRKIVRKKIEDINILGYENPRTITEG